LVDLPMHGDSRGQPGPHTLAAAAADVLEVMRAAGDARAVIGHSFGGKVALSLLDHRPPGLEQVWSLDSAPSARAGRDPRELTPRVIAALRELPPVFADRNAFVAELEQRGIEASIARWLAKNLRRDAPAEGGAAPGALRFGLDLDAIGELLADYDRSDLWPAIDRTLAERAIALGFVLAGHGSVVGPSDRQRLAELAARGAIALHELPNAGHFLHVDDPDGLFAVIAAALQ
jgi:pimeloyl-ACP methyl ester carboxylesterase